MSKEPPSASDLKNDNGSAGNYNGFAQASTKTIFNYDDGNASSLTSGTNFDKMSPLPSQTRQQTSTATAAGPTEIYTRPPTSSLYSRGNLTSSYQRTGVGTSLARPSTAVRAVGYTSEAGKSFDQIVLQKVKQQPFATIEAKDVDPQLKYKHLETKISSLLEASVLISNDLKPNHSDALSKAKEASSLDRTLLRLRDQNGETSFHNFDLTNAVFFNLAEQYEKNDMFVEALNTYNIMTKNKMFQHVNHLKLNMGNIYFRMGIYPKAIKMYRMALDSVPNNHKQLRLKITQNIGILFIKMGQYSDAAASFEFVMSERADIRSGIQLVLCYYAIGDADKIKTAFKALVDVQLDYEDDVKIQTDYEETQENRYIYLALKNDELAAYSRTKKKFAEKSITMIVDLISSIIEENYNDGYTWCIEVIKTSGFAWLANELELNKALVYLRQNDVNQAIETLRFYERKDPTMAANALTNLTFIYIYLSDLENATKCVEKCRKIDNTNPAAFINSSVVEIMKGDFQSAKKNLEAALVINKNSFEAQYNMGLVLRHLDDLDSSEQMLNQLKETMSHAKHPHIYYQLAKIQELDESKNEALEMYLQLLGISNEMDSRMCQKVGELYESFNDRQEANQYYNEAYRINPSDINIASSIGSYYIKLQAVEKAIYYYERAVLANPNDPNLMLRVASCFRHIYMPKNYLTLFEKIYSRFPENLPCLRALMHVTKSQGMSELYEKYSIEFSRVEKKFQSRQNSARGNGNRSSRRSGRQRGGNNELSSGNSNNRDSNSAKSNESYDNIMTKGYADPLGPPAERPRTGMVRPSSSKESDDDLNADELLPM